MTERWLTEMAEEIAALRRLHADGRLCLFVGAGVSMSCGLPDWNTLSALITAETWPDQVKKGIDFDRSMTRALISQQNPLDAMRIARRVQDNNFNAVVSKCLYSGDAHPSEIVSSIVALGNVRRICCFNYDDVLENAYQERGTAYRPLTEGDDLPTDSPEVLVFHPHGFLPRANYSRNYSAEAIVLSEDDYHELYSSPYSWPNVIQLNLLLSFNVLFVGCSLKDPNIRRLLDISKNITSARRHFAIMRLPHHETKTKWWGWFKAGFLRDVVEDPLLRDRGVTPLWVNQYEQIPVLLNSIK